MSITAAAGRQQFRPARSRPTPSTRRSGSRCGTWASRRSAARSRTSRRRSPTASSPAPRGSRASRRRTRTCTPTCSSPEFFDAERHPEVTFSGTRGHRRGRRGRVRRRDHDQGRHAAGHAARHARRPGRPIRTATRATGSSSRPRSTAPRSGSSGTPTCPTAPRRSPTRSPSRPTSRWCRRHNDAHPRHLRQPPPRLAQHLVAAGRGGAPRRRATSSSCGTACATCRPTTRTTTSSRRPPPSRRCATAVADADAVLIATPEYNSSIPGALKNALDWASRPFATNAFRNKPVAVIGSSTGLFGAVWAQAELRKVLGGDGRPRRRGRGRRRPGARSSTGRAADRRPAIATSCTTRSRCSRSRPGPRRRRVEGRQ